MLKYIEGFRRVRRSIWLVLAIFVLMGYSVQNVAGNCGYHISLRPCTTVTMPPVILQNGTAGTSTIYANGTSAKASVIAPVYLDGWDKRAKITIDHNDIDSDLPDFPVLVYLSSSSGRNNDDVTFVFDEVGSNSKKIAVTTSDGTTECYVEIEKWNATSEEAWLWVNVPSINNTVDTDLYLYYDSNQPDNTNYVGDTNSTVAENVWDTDFKLVHHFEGTSGSEPDSTSNDNDATVTGATRGATGKIGPCHDLDGDDDRLLIPNSTSLDVGNQFTAEEWVKWEGGEPSRNRIWERKSAWDGADGWTTGLGEDETSDTCYHALGGGTEFSDIVVVDSWVAGEWHYLVTFFNDTSFHTFCDGIMRADGTIDYAVDNDRDLLLGEYGGGSGYNWNGKFDEFRLSDSIRSAAWIKASYESGRDELLDFAAPEYIYVDNNTSNVDSSDPEDKGTHSNFTTQEYLDGIYDTLTEADASTSDNNIDSEIITHGSTTGISGAQTTDGTTENMTEASGGGDYNDTVMSFNPDYRWILDGDETDSVDDANSDGGNDPSWVNGIIPNSDATYCGDYDGSVDETLIPNKDDINVDITYEKSISVWIIADTIDTSGNGRTIWSEGYTTNNLVLYTYEDSGTDKLYWKVMETSGSYVDYISYPISTGVLYHIGVTLDCNVEEMRMYINGTEVANKTGGLNIDDEFASHQAGCGIGLDYDVTNHNEDSLTGLHDGRIADLVYWAEQDVLTGSNFTSIYNAGTTSGDCQLDIEHVVNSIVNYQNYNLTTRAYRTASENYYLQMYNFTSSQWINFSTITASSLTWYNTSFAKTYFVNSTNQARIRYWQGVDATKEILYVDYSGLYGWNATTNYELNLEVQWTSADYTETNEELCIKTGTFSSSENLMVYAWNVSTSDWHWVMNLTASQWNNVSITSYLTSSTFTVQFLGGTEMGDTNQDSWNVDATLLHVWTDDVTFDYVLRVNNTGIDSWQIRLKKYSDFNITRLQNCTICFHNSTDGTSSQIYIQNGSYINQTGPWYDLGDSETIYIAMTVRANSTGTSYVRTYLEILVPDTTTYAQYVITFEIT